MKKIRVMMVDDEPLIRKVVKMEMNSRAANVETGDLDASVVSRVEMVETFADGPALMAALGTTEAPDYLLVDMEFSGEPTGGLMIVRRVHERYPGIKKNAAGGFSIENILRAIACLERGERFYFNYPVMLTLKEAAESYFTLVADHDPDFGLTDKERQLLLLEAAGCTAAEISDRLGETDKAIQERQKDLSRRLDIVNKSAARVAKAFALGLIAPSEVRFLPRS